MRISQGPGHDQSPVELECRDHVVHGPAVAEGGHRVPIGRRALLTVPAHRRHLQGCGADGTPCGGAWQLREATGAQIQARESAVSAEQADGRQQAFAQVACQGAGGPPCD